MFCYQISNFFRLRILMHLILASTLGHHASSCCLKGAMRLFTFATHLNLGSQPEPEMTAAIYALLMLTSVELWRYYLYERRGQLFGFKLYQKK